ncbi:nuclear transport factor 2 family protein [Cryptosporangium aurantiacum]|uniref:SnoaL-like domain-containing protein n=1 Tax=Cryptosporangium aurantiacum TaxID=134849 RepID=A0A1M7RLJ1_9ACTN|nr:nuclear transport factor 2 family protein [Cryptosporangium aurantiacum]SHN47114.1 SnoaL-like domain-containing protein [Cryptosporangium aurantiacum]
MESRTLEHLLTLEDIRQLKYRYLRSVDQKLWDQLADTLTEDAVADYGTPAMGDRLVLTGREAIVSFMRENLGPGLISVHLAGQPEIQVNGDHATGTWAFSDLIIAPEYKVVIEGAAFYEDTYARGEDGVWRISRTGYDRLFESSMSLDDLPSYRLTANRWAGAPTTH